MVFFQGFGVDRNFPIIVDTKAFDRAACAFAVLGNGRTALDQLYEGRPMHLDRCGDPTPIEASGKYGKPPGRSSVYETILMKTAKWMMLLDENGGLS